jgi:hypothetical protein
MRVTDLLRSFSVLTIAVLAPPAALAVSLSGPIYEPFDYTTVDGVDTSDGDLNGNNGGTGFGAPPTAWVQTTPAADGAIVAGSLAGLVTSGNRLRMDAVPLNTNKQDPRGLGQSIDTGTLYFSFLTEKNNVSNRTINVAFFTGTTEKLGIGQYGTAAGTSNGNFAMVFLNSNPGNLIQNTTAPIAYGVDVPHLVIGRIDFNASGVNERVRFYIDPSSYTIEPAVPYLDNSGFDLGAIDIFRPFTGNTVATPLDAVSADFDEFRFDTTYAGVAVTGLIPEPSAALLGGCGLLALVGRRRR